MAGVTTHVVAHPNGVEEVSSAKAAAGHGTVDHHVNITLMNGDTHRYYGANGMSVVKTVADSGVLAVKVNKVTYRHYGVGAWVSVDTQPYEDVEPFVL